MNRRYGPLDEFLFPEVDSFVAALEYTDEATKGTLSDGEHILFHDAKLRAATEYYVRRYCATNDLSGWQPVRMIEEKRIELVPEFSTIQEVMRWIVQQLYEDQVINDPAKIDPARPSPQIYSIQGGAPVPGPSRVRGLAPVGAHRGLLLGAQEEQLGIITPPHPSMIVPGRLFSPNVRPL